MAEQPLPRISIISTCEILWVVKLAYEISGGERDMQVAIVSTDGVNVDEHFGRAERFLIYEIRGDSQMILAVEVVPSLAEGDKSHGFNPGKFSEITTKLTGCKRVYCTRIGDRPAVELKKLGIEPVIHEGAIKGIVV